MENLKTFVKMWEETGDIAKILEKGIALPAPDVVQAHLDTLTEDERARILKCIADAVDALTRHIADLEAGKMETQNQIDTSLKTAQACLSYNETGKTEKK
jgi:transcription elongation GreA/GreB family factor